MNSTPEPQSRPATRRVALVTGGGSGIGRATALALGARGLSVAVSYRASRAGATEVVDRLRAEGVDAEAFEADVTATAAVAALADAVAKRLGGIDVLVNNAGDMIERVTLGRISEPLLRQILDVNVLSTVLCSQAFAPQMIARGGGAIVNMSSLAAHSGGGPGAWAYAAAKAAIVAITKGLAKELAPHRIRVNCVAPGLIGDTAFHAKFTTPDVFAATERSIPLGRAGTPDEVARVIAFLAGDDASFLTGETIEINGGALMR